MVVGIHSQPLTIISKVKKRNEKKTLGVKMGSGSENTRGGGKKMVGGGENGWWRCKRWVEVQKQVVVEKGQWW